MESLFLNYGKKEAEACVYERNHNAACLVLFIQPGFRSKHCPRSVSDHKWGGLMHSWFYG